MNEKKSKELLVFLKETIAKVSSLAGEIKLDSEKSQDITLASLYCSLIEIPSNVVSLVEQKQNLGVPILSRAFLEAYVEILNMISEPEYIESFEFQGDFEWKKIIEEAEKGNVYLKAIANSDNFEAYKKRIQNNIEAGKAKNLKLKKISEKFKSVDMEEEYRSVFKLWSWQAHSTVNAVHERFYDVESGQISLFKEVSIERQVQYLLLICEGLLDATTKIHSFFGNSVSKEIDEINSQLARNKKTWLEDSE